MTNHQPLLYTYRENVQDACYWGSVFLFSQNSIEFSFGQSAKTLYFMRSLAKPIQASCACDYDFFKDLKIPKKYIALFCASHAGSQSHIRVLKEIISKYNIKISQIDIAPQTPLDIRNFNGRKTKLHNNCSAKHILMILLSLYLGYDIKGYCNSNHPIQKLIKQKQDELSEYKSSILSYDGCSTPLWALPCENIARAYFNFFNTQKYNILHKSVLSHPYLFGGYNRLDSEIIKLSESKLFSKVGAGGFVLVYNYELNQILIVKLAQNNNEIRRLIVFDILNKLKWLNIKNTEFEYNQKNQKVAKYFYKISI